MSTPHQKNSTDGRRKRIKTVILTRLPGLRVIVVPNQTILGTLYSCAKKIGSRGSVGPRTSDLGPWTLDLELKILRLTNGRRFLMTDWSSCLTTPNSWSSYLEQRWSPFRSPWDFKSELESSRRSTIHYWHTMKEALRQYQCATGTVPVISQTWTSPHQNQIGVVMMVGIHLRK